MLITKRSGPDPTGEFPDGGTLRLAPRDSARSKSQNAGARLATDAAQVRSIELVGVETQRAGVSLRDHVQSAADRGKIVINTVVRDITERRKAEDQIRRHQRGSRTPGRKPNARTDAVE